MLKGMLNYISKFSYVFDRCKEYVISYPAFLLPCIHVICGGTIRHRAFIS